jgi:transcriptional regulator with XRE-family HTH domain
MTARIGMTVRRLRQGRAMSQLALAKKARISQAYLSRLEAGIQNNPSVSVLQRLAKALGVPLTELLPLGTPPHARRTRGPESLALPPVDVPGERVLLAARAPSIPRASANAAVNRPDVASPADRRERRYSSSTLTPHPRGTTRTRFASPPTGRTPRRTRMGRPHTIGAGLGSPGASWGRSWSSGPWCGRGDRVA